MKDPQKQTFTDDDFLCECCGQPLEKILKARGERGMKARIKAITIELYKQAYADGLYNNDSNAEKWFTQATNLILEEFNKIQFPHIKCLKRVDDNKCDCIKDSIALYEKQKERMG